METDYYTLLGVSPTADEREIRHAYREHARHLHPDVNKEPDAAERFSILASAYAVLSDPARRRAYDVTRTGAPVQDALAPEMKPHSPRGTAAVPRDEPSLRGLDVEQTVTLTLREAAFGVDKNIIVARRAVCGLCHGDGAAPGAVVQQCPRCHGTGRDRRPGEECERCHGAGVTATIPCPGCDGAGRISVHDEFALHFPPAIEDGEELRIRNEGDPGPRGGPRGDLRLRVQVEPDPVLRRVGSEVYADIDVTAAQAARGDAIALPTLHGQSRLSLPRGVADGTVLTMKRRGLRLKGRFARGDQHVTVHVSDA